jgi:hypothetical protein
VVASSATVPSGTTATSLKLGPTGAGTYFVTVTLS